MAKLNFNDKKDISLMIPGTEEPFTVSVVKAYSWSKIVAMQSFLDMTCDTIRRWYWSRKSLEGVVDGYPVLWKHIKDVVGECFLLDYINQGEFSYHKDMLIADFDQVFGGMFESAFAEIKAVWGDLAVDQTTKQAYRALRKEARGRVTGIGFGFSGGIKAAAGAELGNLATGMAHSVLNAIGNSIDNASTNGKMSEFYNQESTLEEIIDTWIAVFWRMYNNHISMINGLLVEEETPQIWDYSRMMGLRDSAQTIFENMQKAANLSSADFWGGICRCIKDFPFEAEYWKILSKMLVEADGGSRELISAIHSFAKEVDVYTPSFYDEISADLIESMMGTYIAHTVQDSTYTGQDVIDLFKESAGDEIFEKNFLISLNNLFLDNNTGLREIEIIKNLLSKNNIDLQEYLRDDAFSKTYESKMDDLAIKCLQEKFETIFLPALLSGDISQIVDELEKTPVIDPDAVLFALVGIFYQSVSDDGDKFIKPDVLSNIEKLKESLHSKKDINTIKRFRILKQRAVPFEQKVNQFQSFLNGIIRENGEGIMGKHAYWGKFPSETVKNMREHLKIPSNEYFLAAFDDTVFSSGKSGLVVTPRGIYCQTWYLTWTEIADSSKEISIFDESLFINFEEKIRGSSIHSIEFSKLAVNIDFSVLSNILFGACLIFTGLEIKSRYFSPVVGAEFDLSKLELSISTNDINQSSEQTQEVNQNITTQPPNTDISKDQSFEQGLKPIENTEMQPLTEKPEDRYNFLREDDRIYRALKFKAKKGFFKHILPSSWIVTIGFYGLLALLILIAAGVFVSQTNSELLIIIVSNLTLIVIPIILLIVGIKNRVKYMKEKKIWKECTDNGKQKIEDVYMEFEKLEKDFLGL